MTSAEKKMVLFLMYDGAPDCCKKCVHLNLASCCLYNPETGKCDGEHLDDNRCIDGMIKYFEQQE